MSGKLITLLGMTLVLMLTALYLDGQSEHPATPEPGISRETGVARKPGGRTSDEPASLSPGMVDRDDRQFTAVAPVDHIAGSGRHRVRAADFERLLESYDSLSARTLEAFNSRYRGAVEFDSESEFDWLRENGFPLPEEILGASDLTRQQLRQQAATGGETARFLYLDRLLEDALNTRTIHTASGLAASTLTDNPEFVSLFLEADRLRSQIADSQSPFAGYLLSRYSRVALENPYGELAGLYHAYVLGDVRAIEDTETLMRERGMTQEARKALGAYTSVLRRSGRDLNRAGTTPAQ